MLPTAYFPDPNFNISLIPLIGKSNKKPNDSIDNLINSDPVVVSSEMVISDAMKMMEDRQSQISVLPVIENKKCVGLLRLHDLYQTKLL